MAVLMDCTLVGAGRACTALGMPEVEQHTPHATGSIHTCTPHAGVSTGKSVMSAALIARVWRT